MVEIRPMEAADLPQIKALLQNAWRDAEDADQAVIDAMLFLDLNAVMHESTFGRVAVDGLRVIGAVFCAQQDEDPAFRRFQSDGVKEALSLLRAGQRDVQWVVEHYRLWANVYAQLMLGHNRRYQVQIELLYVDPQWQQRSVAAALVDEALAYCQKQPTAYLAALASTPAQADFFDKAGFTRCAQAQAKLDLATVSVVCRYEKAVR